MAKPCPICSLFNIPKLMELAKQFGEATAAVHKLLDLANGVEPPDFDLKPEPAKKIEYGPPPKFFRPRFDDTRPRGKESER